MKHAARLRARLTALLAAVALAVAAPAVADWWEVYRADASFDLGEARRQALAAVAEDPQGADAVASAAWWHANLSHLGAAADIVDAAGEPRDPELAFELARIEGELRHRPPAGALAEVELAGPFGRFPRLDLERGVVPEDADLPPLGTPWRDGVSPFRLLLTTPGGSATPPETMAFGGVYLAAWTVGLEAALEGWLVVEAGGSFNLEVDGRPVARLRDCGTADPGVSWYRVRMEAGDHRLRVEMGSSPRPRVRLSLFDDHGAAARTTLQHGVAGGWAPSTVEAASPPARAALERRLAEGEGSVPELLLAATLARSRADPVAARSWLERARDLAPADPWPRLGLASFFLEGATGGEPTSDARRARDELRRCQELPLSRLLEHTLAAREDRPDDAERLLAELVAEHGDDPRVLEPWVAEAVDRGWVREAEEGLVRLEAALPSSASVIALRLDALAALDRWGERRELLQTLLRSDALDPALLDEAVAGCQLGEAVAALERLRSRFDDPGLDMSLARLELARGDRARAAAALERAVARWGPLPALDQVRLALAAGEPGGVDASLALALGRDPGNLGLHALAWRQGKAPFFAPFSVSYADVLAKETTASGDVDAVLLLDQAVERLFEDGSSLYYYHGVTRALTPVGARQAASLQPLTDALWLKVRVHRADGREEVPSDLTPHDGEVVLEDVKPGDVVEEEYVAGVGPTMAAARGHLSPYIYRFADPERAFGLSEYILLVPRDVELAVEGNFTGLAREEWDQDGLRAVRWRAERVPPVQPEPFAPPTQELLPWVSYGFGVSWQDVGDALRDRTLQAVAAGVDLERWGASVAVGEDPTARVRALVGAVCDLVKPGRSDLELATTAGASFGRRTGNRLGIVAAVLLEQGWTVDLVLARPRPLAGTHLGVPSLDTFSEPLLRASSAGSQVWIDLGEERRGVGHVSAILQGGDALVLPLSDATAAVTILDHVPSFPNPELEQRVRVTATVQEDGTATLRMEMALNGGEAQRLREQLGGMSEGRASMAFEQLAAGLFPGAEEVRGSLEDRDGSTVLALDLRLPGACERERADLVCRSLVLGRPLVPALASLPSRSYPLILQLPIQRRLTLTLRPPAGYTVDRPPRKLSTQWGSLEETVESADGAVRSQLGLEIPAQTVSPEDYPQFARFCHALDELMSRPPRLVATHR